MPLRKPLVVVGNQVQQLPAGDSLGVRAAVDGTTANPTSTNAAFVQIPEMVLNVTTIGGQLLVLFDATFRIFGNDNFNFALFLDGVEVAGTRRQIACTFTLSLGILNIDNQQPSSAHVLLTLAAGAHTVDVRWAQIAGVARANGTQRKLTTVEMF